MTHFFFSKKILISAMFFIGCMTISLVSLTNAGGPPSKMSGAPGEKDCTDCHNGTAVTSGKKWNGISLTTNTGTTDYIPDSTYTVTLSYTESGITKYGFALTALKSSDNKLAGTLTKKSNATKVITGTVSGNSRDYMVQTSTGNSFSNNTASWTFDWKAPSSNVGDVIFYVSFNATNNNGNDGGDVVYVKSFTFTPSALLPVASISPKSSIICIGDTVSALGSSTNNATDWAWNVTPAANVNALTKTSQDCKFVFSTAGNYTLTMRTKNDKGYSLYDTAKVTVYDRPIISAYATGSVQLCPGSAVNLKLQGDLSGCTVLWNSGQTDSMITVSSAGDYFATITNSNGCSALTNTVTVSMLQTPQAYISGANNGDVFCSNTLPNITAPNGANSYAWKINGTNAGSTQMLSLIGQTGTFNIELSIDSGGCSSMATPISITINEPLAKPTATYSSTQTSVSIMWGAVANATGYEVSEDGGNSWISPSSGATGLTHDATGLQPNQNYSYLIHATGASPCGNGPDETVVALTSNCQSVSYAVSFDSSVCAGTNAQITFQVNVSKWNLKLNGQNQGNTQQFTLSNLMADTTIQLELVDSDFISCPATTGSFTIKVNATPVLNFQATPVSNSFDINCTDQTAGAVSWTWDFGDSKTSNLQNPSHTYTTAGNYTVSLMVTNDKGCISTSSTQVGVTGPQTTGLNLVNAPVFSAYPNPIQNELNLRGLTLGGLIRIMDMTGKLVFETKNETGDILLSLDGLKAGTYFLIWQKETERHSVVLLKE